MRRGEPHCAAPPLWPIVRRYSIAGPPAGSVIVEAPEPARDLGPAPKPKRRSFPTYEQALGFVMRRPNVERTRPKQVAPHAFKLDRMRMLA